MLRETAMPALVELDFISNPDWERKMRTDEWRERCEAVAALPEK